MDEAAALDRLRQILGRPEFNVQTGLNAWEVLSQIVRDWLYNWLVSISQPVGEVLEGYISWVLIVVLVVAVALLGGVGWLIYRAVSISLVAETLDRRRDARARRERSDELWGRAQLLAAEGKYAEAVRELYLSALYALEEHALLQVQAGLTNREHANRVAREHPELSDVFGSVVQRYDRLRYGAYAADAASFGELSGLVDRTRRLA